MINQQLIDFVKQALIRGETKIKITSDLVNKGWLLSDIEECFNVIASPVFIKNNVTYSSKKVFISAIVIFLLAISILGYFFRNDIPIVKDLVKSKTSQLNKTISNNDFQPLVKKGIEITQNKPEQKQETISPKINQANTQSVGKVNTVTIPAIISCPSDDSFSGDCIKISEPTFNQEISDTISISGEIRSANILKVKIQLKDKNNNILLEDIINKNSKAPLDFSHGLLEFNQSTTKNGTLEIFTIPNVGDTSLGKFSIPITFKNFGSGKISTKNQFLEVTSPTPYQNITNPFDVSGKSNFWDGNTGIRIKDDKGLVLVDGIAQASGSGENLLYPFSVEVPYDKPVSKTGTVEIFGISLEDGSDINKIIIPVSFGD